MTQRYTEEPKPDPKGSPVESPLKDGGTTR